MTFGEQSERWLRELQTRKRNPIKASSAQAFRSHLNELQALPFGKLELESINNRTLRELVPQLSGGPKTVNCKLTTVKAVIASALDENGEPVYKRKWNTDYIDAPEVGKQRQPVFTAEQVAAIVANGNGTGLLFKTAAASGLRIGELLALTPEDLKGQTLIVNKTLWQDEIQTPKTKNGFREVDISKALSNELQGHISTPHSRIFAEAGNYGNALVKLHQVLDTLGIEHTGFHAFRRFRKTWLGKQKVQRELIKYWLGHAKSDVTDGYDKVEQDVEFRLSEAERAGLGF